MKQNEQWENFIEFVKFHQSTVSELVDEMGSIWVGETEILGNYDRSIIRKRYVASISEINNHHRLYMWYGNAEYTPPIDMDFDFDDNAWFQKKSIQGFYSIINLNIQYKQRFVFSASFSDLLGTLGTKEDLSEEFSTIQDMKFWLFNLISQSLHHFAKSNKT